MSRRPKSFKDVTVRETDSLRTVMERMTRSRIGIAIVVDRSMKLLGIITDNEVRKTLLRGGDISLAAGKAMNPKPYTVLDTLAPEEIGEVFRRTGVQHLPVVDASGRLRALAAGADFVTIPRRHPNWVVVMAGGIGSRLRPLTEDTPKPMLRMGEKPLLELLLEQLKDSGFTHFMFSVNHLAEKIRSHFKDGSRWGVQIEYINEKKPLGTVGALSLIRRELKAPLLVINGDILTKLNFGALLDFHKDEGVLATICVRTHEFQVPYGVIEVEHHRLRRLTEKPVQRAFINAGIYALEPKVLGWLERNKRCDMPKLLSAVRRHRPDGVACFPIQEYWMDIGGLSEFRKAAQEFDSIFGRSGTQ